jgi:hypothetical protein
MYEVPLYGLREEVRKAEMIDGRATSEHASYGKHGP